MAMSQQEKDRRARERLLEKAREYTTGTYRNKFVAPVFQRMIRAEAGAEPAGKALAIKNGILTPIDRKLGEVVCVTSGEVGPWAGGIGGMHTGHFLASRTNAIIFDEDNVAPQSSHDNRYQSGAPQRFRKWMLEVRGEETVRRLERLKRETVSFTREELVDKRIEYTARLKTAMGIMAGLVDSQNVGD